MLGFDYSQDAIYFVTSCCKDRTHYFGEIINREMKMNKYGEIAHKQILWLETQYPYVELHNFVVMPNHIHILFEINRNAIPVGSGRDRTQNDETSQNDGTFQNLRSGRDLTLHKIKSISSLMGAYKTTSSKQIHLLGNENFLWQRSFHDHIVRDSKRYDNIFNYINTNPARWNEDVFNKETNSNYTEND
jgi:putative transposase